MDKMVYIHGTLVTILCLSFLPASLQSSLQCGQSSPCNQGFVINGSPTCSSEFPWYAALVKPSLVPGQSQLKPFCGASIISRKFLVSAGHCFQYSKGDKLLTPDDFRVYPGFDDRSVRRPTYHFVKRLEVHEDWLEHTEEFDRGNDLALIELFDPIDFSGSMFPICLPSVDQRYLVQPGKKVRMAGFGSIRHFQNKFPSRLQKGLFEMVKCNSENNICADEVEKGQVISSTCRGDSGGGLVGQDGDSYFLVGVVSWGRQCGAVNFTTRYVNMFNHLQWINHRICLTEGGNLCLLPFQYKRTNYTQCLTLDVKIKASCPTVLDSRGEGDGWQFCSQQCPGFKQSVDGGFGPWSDWGRCSKTCDVGSRRRTRECNNPLAQYGGAECEGDYEEVGECNVKGCYECETEGEKCLEIEWLRSQNKCENMVNIYDDVNSGNNLTLSETIYEKTCRYDPYAVCCAMDITGSSQNQAPTTTPTTTQITTTIPGTISGMTYNLKSTGGANSKYHELMGVYSISVDGPLLWEADGSPRSNSPFPVYKQVDGPGLLYVDTVGNWVVGSQTNDGTSLMFSSKRPVLQYPPTTQWHYMEDDGQWMTDELIPRAI